MFDSFLEVDNDENTSEGLCLTFLNPTEAAWLRRFLLQCGMVSAGSEPRQTSLWRCTKGGLREKQCLRSLFTVLKHNRLAACKLAITPLLRVPGEDLGQGTEVPRCQSCQRALVPDPSAPSRKRRRPQHEAGDCQSSTKPAATLFHALPTDAYRLVLEFLTHKRLCRIACGSQLWRDVVQGNGRAVEDLWQSLYTRKFQAEFTDGWLQRLAQKGGWRAVFRKRLLTERLLRGKAYKSRTRNKKIPFRICNGVGCGRVFRVPYLSEFYKHQQACGAKTVTWIRAETGAAVVEKNDRPLARWWIDDCPTTRRLPG